MITFRKILFQSKIAMVVLTFMIIFFSKSAYAVEQTVFSSQLEIGAGLDVLDCDKTNYKNPDKFEACVNDKNKGDPDFDYFDDKYPTFVANGRINIPLGDFGIAIQLDFGGIANFTSRDNSENQFHNYFYGGQHIAYRDPSSYSVGAFTSFGVAGGGKEESAVVWLAGLEGQKYFGNLTLYSQAGYFEADDAHENDVMSEGRFIRGIGRYFFGDNTMLNVRAAYVDGERAFRLHFNQAPDTTVKVIDFGGRIEHGFKDGRISLFLDYNQSRISETKLVPCNNCSSGTPRDDYIKSLTAQTFLVGLKFNFGSKSLKHQDRYGATFEQPDVGRWVGFTQDMVD